MHEIQIPSGVEINVSGNTLTVKGKLGATAKVINPRLFTVRIAESKVIVEDIKNKKLGKKSALASNAFQLEIQSSIKGVQHGIEKKMVIFFAHFPMTIEVKGNKIIVKNIFGERIPRETTSVGSTKIEVKGAEVTVKGVDPYDVGQTVGNIRKVCFTRGNDTRVFQDGIYLSKVD